MTLPALIAEHREKQYVVSLKKSYSILSQLYLDTFNEYGPPENWKLYGPQNLAGSKNWYNTMFKGKTKIVKLCEGKTGCFPSLYYQSLRGGNNVNLDVNYNMVKMILGDGTLIALQSYSESCDAQANQDMCGNIYIDVNGSKNPNKFGVDLFIFNLSKKGIRAPEFAADKQDLFYPECNVVKGGGSACAAWVVYNENMDYLHCNDLSWDGKTKCK